MKRLLIVTAFLFMMFELVSQVQYYETCPDPQHPEVKILKGLINKYILQNDTAFKWYHVNQNGYKPDSTTINVLEKNKDQVYFIIFGGTWCEDSQSILPKFFKLLEMAGISDSMITFFGVDRDKKSPGSIAQAFGITHVPTIILMRNGKELGRVVEYGKTGKWDKEIADIVK